MLAGWVSVILWLNVITPATGIDGIVPSTIANLIVFIGSHYLLKQPGGWVRAKDIPDQRSTERVGIMQKLLSQFYIILRSNLVTYCKNQTPRNETVYLYFAFATLFTAIITLTLDKAIYINNFFVVNQLQTMVLFISTIFFCNKLWPADFREKYIGLIWHISIFISLAFVSSFLVLMSVFGVLASYLLYKWYMGVDDINAEIEIGLQFKIMYVLLLVSSVLIAFLKPKQEYQQLTEEKNEHLSGRIGSQEKQLREALSLRSQFIRNVNHEYHAPMAGITSMAETLAKHYDKLTDQQCRMAIENILKSSRRLDIFDSNLSTLSKLSKAGYELNKEQLNLSDLVYDRIEICRKLYEDNKEEREFILSVQEDIIFNGDKCYLTQVLDNLIINAITYCKKGKITVSLKQENNNIQLTITDEGIGIPSDELEDIFNEFVVSSKTRSSAGGRGVGLALCKRVIEVHGGEIKAESDGEKGATFKIILPT